MAAVAAAGCGGSESTTVIKEAPVRTVEQTTTVQAQSAKSRPEDDGRESAGQKAPPNVVDLPLDVAEELLEEAGYRVAASNTDTTFGIVVPSHYTVCTQDPPRGQIVPVLAQKYGC
ncbi:MAG TPA: PASTA domain-containing protein [Arthrobacter sp.]|jgi:hypothetical protein|nr:PASTA domain-containing protein [Arthrobacter sp.]